MALEPRKKATSKCSLNVGVNKQKESWIGGNFKCSSSSKKE